MDATNESEERCYLPDAGRDLAELRHLLDADDDLQLVLTREGAEGTVGLPDVLCQMLVQAVDVMNDGQAVVVVARPPMLTTQQAADILEVPRSAVTQLIADGELPKESPSARRGIRLADVLDYREHHRLHQHEMLVETFSGLSAGTTDDEAPIEASEEKAAPEGEPSGEE